MTSEPDKTEIPQVQTTITLSKESEWWVAKDEGSGVTSQGKSRVEALEMLDEAVALHKGEIGESIDTWGEEKVVLEDLGLDPEELKANRDAVDGLPEFMK